MKVVIMPAYNEEQTVGAVAASVRPLVDAVFVIDDGSTDRTAVVARAAGAHVLSHVINRGLGAAIQTGIVAARRAGADIAVTFDADGQHRAEDIPRMCAPIEVDEADVVLGCRTVDRGQMPLVRRLCNVGGNALTFLLFGLWVKDSQSGLRAFNRHALASLALSCDRMEVSSEIVKEIHARHLRLVEVPIAPVYTKYSLSKGQSLTVGIATAAKLLLNKVMG